MFMNVRKCTFQVHDIYGTQKQMLVENGDEYCLSKIALWGVKKFSANAMECG